MKLSKSKRLNHYIKLACLTGALFCYSASAYAEVMPNTQLPVNGQWIMGGPNSNIINPNDTVKFDNNTMNIKQEEINAVIKWGKFSIGSIATVNFDTANRDGNGQFNILNYDAGGSMSQIRGTLKSTAGGNIFIVNPAGVFIGNSAQVDVGSLYVSNKKLDESKLVNFNGANGGNINAMLANDQPQTPAELMSLGHINANNVTFDGNRIVLDTELLTTNGLENKMAAQDILIKTNSKDNVVIGYNAYDVGNDTYAGKNDATKIATIQENDGATSDFKKADGYMWVRDLEQLQAMDTNLDGNYALRNGIGAISTTTGNFTPIGTEVDPFTGKLDGLAGNVDGIDFAIFDLNVKGNSNLGLFGVTDGAEIRNVLLTGGSITGTGNDIGALVGLARNTTIENVRNSINVTGGNNVGGIVGSANGATQISDILNTGDIKGFANIGGVVGSITGTAGDHAAVTGAENIGRVEGVDKKPINNPADDYSHNIGGIAGSAQYADISKVENNLKVEGGYNVGGIVGSGENVNISDAVNTQDVTATGYTEGKYIYTTEVDGTQSRTIKVNVANVGGIAGNISGASSLTDVTNDGGNIATALTTSNTYGDYYHAGNVGGIVGSAVGNDADNTVTITNAENKENTIFGAHNIGGVAGYLENGKITLSSNNGGEITGTGARTSEADSVAPDDIADYKDNFAYESIRFRNNESFLIGNMGGIVGYMYGDNAFVSQSGNRGNVHSQLFTGEAPLTAKAANVGGIVGKINRDATSVLNDIIANESTAAVYDCYNRGDIQGYTGVGGVIGLMYNGAVAASDNSGTVMATRASSIGSSVEALNMGGIVGDTTEEGSARAIIYDVHNDGVIGSSVLTDFYGRHVGGVVGRLSGEVEKTYNTGAIYNGYNVVGGIAGYMAAGKINNSFNTGNITVYNQNNATSQVGGIVGGVDAYYQIEISNAYNLGTLRSFKGTNNGAGDNTVGGIVGGIVNWTPEQNESVTISNVYTLGNLYSYANNGSETDNMGAIVSSFRDVGGNCVPINPTISNAYYIKPEITSNQGGFSVLSDDKLNGAKAIEFANRSDWQEYQQTNQDGNVLIDSNGNPLQFGFSDASLVDGKNDFGSEGAWRIYKYRAPDGSQIATTPILNAFMPKSNSYFGNNSDGDKPNRKNIDSVQYGTAYNPLLTIINAKTPDADATDITNDMYTIEFDWNKINPDRSASFAVFNGNLSINDFDTNGRLYGGTLYAKGALSINNVYSETQDNDGKTYVNSGDVLLGSGAKLYGSTINVTSGEEKDGTLTNGGKLVNYGTIRSTGQVGTNSSITLRAEGDVEIIGEVTSNGEENVVVPNIGRYPTDTENGDLKQQIIANIAKKDEAMPAVGEYYSRRFTAESKSGDITITSQNGDVDVLLGVAGKGYINSSKNLTIAGKNVYVDSDLSISKNFALNAAEDTVLDITNIGAVTRPNDQETARKEFVKHFKTTAEGDTNSNTISFSNVADAIITMDLWNGNSFELASHTPLGNALRDLKVEGVEKGFDLFHIWIDDAAALQGINNTTDTNILTYNFALKNDIDAQEFSNTFTAIGVNNAFTGKFNGRGNAIVGLDVKNDANAGLFSEVGDKGEVSNLSIYSSTFKGEEAGAVAGVNNGKIDNITTFGNRVESTVEKGNAGGTVGTNTGIISNASNNDAVAVSGAGGNAGGIAGKNTGSISSSVANSNVTAMVAGANAIGGVVGVNSGADAKLDTVRSLGIVNGTYNNGTVITNNVGGIAGINNDYAQITKAYNVAQVSGGDNVGGIVGNGTVGNLQEVVSAGDIISSGTNVGGIIGKSDEMVINSGRNTGEVTGNENVGGIVGVNGSQSRMNNIINDANATIKGVNNVGGLAGINAGKIVASDMGLVNDGRVYGQTNVGGITGVNTGTIENTNSNITLYVADKNREAKYFGGVAGRNEGTITNATNTGSVLAEGAEYVGGIVGVNGTLVVDASGNPDLDANGNEKFEAGNSAITGAGNSNSGKVVGAKYVGGVAGLNVGQVVGTAHDGVVEIQNQGTVIATNNGAGGIFGENRADISEAVLKNSGTVIGSTLDGTGGIIGLNSGIISNSDLINTVDGLVVGMENVGGLIGINKGTIEGGRDTNGNYYAHQVYNNGTVIGGNGTDVKPADNDLVNWKSKTITDADGNESTIWYQTDTNSHDIGGLIGSNGKVNNDGTVETGSLTAGYNTGIVEGGTKVGGVVGNNAGTVDQVFNAGSRDKVIGIGNDATNYYNLQNSADVSVEDENVWKVYEGGDKDATINYGTNKLLNVFLTKLTFTPVEDFTNMVYNAKEQGFELKNVTATSADVWTVGRENDVQVGTISCAAGAHSLNDLLIASGLLAKNGKTLVGKGYDMFKTKQIDIVENDEIVEHNNLGFDFGTFDIEKATLNIELDDITRVYGNANVTNKNEATDNKHIVDADKYGYTVSVADKGVLTGELNDKMLDELFNAQNGIAFTHDKNNDGAIAGTSGDRVTNNAKTSYDWDGDFKLNNENGNFAFAVNDDGSYTYKKTVEGVQNSEVTKAELTITLSDVVHKYGSPNLNDYGMKEVTGLTNGDELSKDNVKVTMTDDSALKDGNTHTNNAGGDYGWNGNVSGINNLTTNYNISYDGGKSEVTKAELTITVNDSTTTVGIEPTYSLKSILNLVNGDEENDLKLTYNLDSDADWNKEGIYSDAIGALIGNDSIENNYVITIDPGTLTVTDSGTKPDPDPGPGPDNPPTDPTKPVDPTDPTNPDNPYSPDNPHNWQAEDKYPWYQWDKQRHERERKAEVHFVDGGMRVEA